MCAWNDVGFERKAIDTHGTCRITNISLHYSSKLWLVLMAVDQSWKVVWYGLRV